MSTIAQNLDRILSAKTDIRTAIEAKGVTVPSSATIDTYSTYVSQISGGGGGIPMPSNLSDATFNDYGLLTSASIKSGVTSIGDYAFTKCSKLTSITIPNSVTSIGDAAFAYCSLLTAPTIPSGVTRIGDAAFNSCANLTSITVNATTPPTLGVEVFSETRNCPILVPASSVSAYQSAWSDYASRIQAIP